MKLDVKKLYQNHSDRAKSVDIHPTEPWVLSTLYSGRVLIFNYETQAVIKTIDVSELPVRSGKFIARKNWIVVGSDDYHVRVFNYNTGEKVKQFEAHPDYIRVLTVHPSQPFVLTAGDDMSIKLWNWDQDWRNSQTFEGHSHYVMSLAFNPKDPNTFASASLDRTVKIWALGSSVPNFTLETNEARGLNYVDYYPQSDKPYIITTSDDRNIRIWDYQTKSCVATMEGHQHNVSFAVFHPELPIIISGGEDSSVKVWNSNTYKLEQSLNYGLERAWCASCRRGSNLVALGFDTGSVVLQMGKEEPAVSMDPNGKLVWSKHSEVFSHIIKDGAEEDHVDGEILPLSAKDLGNVEVYPTQLEHSPNGRFVAVAGDGEYIIYTALAWRNKAFGKAVEFAWSQDSNEYAVLDASGNARTFKNFKERPLGHVNAAFSGQQIFGGTLLGIKGNEFVAFYDWESGHLVRRIDVDATQVIWSDSGELVAIVTEESVYVLSFNREIFNQAVQDNAVDDDDGVEDSFEVLHSVDDSVRTGKWVGDCFIFTTVSNRLNYLVGGQVYTISHFDKQMYLLGYVTRTNCIYLTDKDINVTSFKLSLAVVEYQTVVLRGDMEYAAELLENVPERERTKVARFLEAQGYADLALDISKDAEHKFELALSLKQLDTAESIAREVDNDHKWKQLGDCALESWNVMLAQECFERAKDLDSLVLIYTSTGNKEKLKAVAQKAEDMGQYNLAFNSQWYIGDTDACIELLKKSSRPSEAALFSLTYGGDVQSCVEKWKEQLNRSGRGKIAKSICEPTVDADQFPSNVGKKVKVQQQGAVDDLIDVDDVEEEEEEAEAEANGETEEAEKAKEEVAEAETEE